MPDLDSPPSPTAAAAAVDDDRAPSRTVLAAYGSLAFPLAGAFIALQVIVSGQEDATEAPLAKQGSDSIASNPIRQGFF